jgi:transketolase
VVYTITPFTTTRCFEQIRVDACYHEAPVVIVGTGSGLSYAELGPTHHSCEDMAILRTLPGMTVLAPADANELRAALRAALKVNGPVYMRIGKKGEPQMHKDVPDLKIGKSITMRKGNDVCLIGTGVMLAVMIDAAKLLQTRGLEARVESFHTIKPLDTSTLSDVFGKYPVVAVAEEHGRIGGLGGSIAEWLAAQAPTRARLLQFGTSDEFMHEIGSQHYARQRFGLTAENIVSQVTAKLELARAA